MGINIWIIFASILLVSARARRYDHGPHTVYDFSTGLATTGPYGHRELILYLTPDQVRSLEADGAVVKSDKDDENDSQLSAEQQSNEEQDEENEDAQEDEEENEEPQEENDEQKEENDNSQEVEENEDPETIDAQQEEESSEEKRNPKIDFETILRLLNDDQVDIEPADEQPSNNSPIEAENSEESRSISPRFSFRRQQQKNVALAAAKNEEIFKTYSNIRYQPYGRRQRFNYQHHQQDYDSKIPEEFDEKLIGTPLQGTKKYKLVPYKIEEPVDEPAPIVNALQQNLKTEDEVQTAKTNKLLRETLLKYAIRVQKLKNSEKTRAEAKAISKDTVVSTLIKQQQSRKQSKLGKARRVDNKQTKPQQPKSIAIPVMMPERSSVQKPIKVPVETSKRVRNEPNIATRKITANKKTKPRRSSKEQS